MIEVIYEDWLARIAMCQLEDIDLQTPEILYISTREIPAPHHARARISDVFDESSSDTLRLMPSALFERSLDGRHRIDPGMRGAAEERHDAQMEYPVVYASIGMPDRTGPIVPIGDALVLSRRPREFASLFSKMRRLAGPDRLIYAPGLADPLNLALLCYFGVDLVDSFGTVMRSMLGQVILGGRVIRSDSEELGRIPDIGSEPGFDTICAHNIAQLERELVLVRDALRQGHLRELVELRARQTPWMIEALRLADREEFDEVEPWTPTIGPAFTAGSKESLWRPDVERYRRRIRERYIPPKSPSILLLLPCSARKPYSKSRSHRRFREVIMRTGLGSAVHEVMVTSPLGIVPRELEIVYPARQYDIPVTGHWDEDEKRIIRDMLRDLLGRREYGHIIAHIDSEMEFLDDILSERGAVATGGDDVLSRENLQNLERSLLSLKTEIAKTTWQERTPEDIAAIASYQFGDAGRELMRGTRIVGAYPMVRILRDDLQLCSLVPEKGRLALTLAGGEAIARTGKYGVEIDDFTIDSNLFAIGVVDASPEIRIGDEVYVHHAGDTRAVGTARMNSMSMIAMNRGEAVHIRHHK